MPTTFLKVKNRAYSLLAESISDSDDTLSVTTGEGAKFPDTFPFHITIGDEILKCTAKITDLFSVTRAQEGTVAANHSAGVEVSLNITAKIVQDLGDAINILEDVPWEKVADASAMAGLTAQIGKPCFREDVKAVYICTFAG